MNTALKAQLSGAARCLATDHVELRRWLCDTGWLARDDFGREYRRVTQAALSERQQVLGAALEAAFTDSGTATYTNARRTARAAEREARRLAHDGARSATN